MDTIHATWTLVGTPKNSEASATTVARNSGWHLDDKVKQSQANGLLHDPWTMQGLALPGTW